MQIKLYAVIMGIYVRWRHRCSVTPKAVSSVLFETIISKMLNETNVMLVLQIIFSQTEKCKAFQGQKKK